MTKPTLFRRLLRAALATMAILALVAVAVPSAPAAAEEYPTWAEVETARESETAKNAQIAELTSLIVGLKNALDEAQAEADKRSVDYADAQSAYDIASKRAMDLQTQADDAAATASESRERAGRVAATLARAGDTDLAMTLFLEGNKAEDLLSQLGSMSKLTERSSEIYESAAEDQNAAGALTDQAKVAQDALGSLAAEAETALEAAIASSERVETALNEQERTEGTLQTQLAVLTEDRAATESDYAKGEQVRQAAEAAALAERVAQQAAAQAAAAALAPSRSTGGASNPPPQGPGGQGWSAPVTGRISSAYGPRPYKPVAGVGAFHFGTDIAAGCGQGVYAVSGGTVVYSGWLGSYGNWVLIDHGDGTQTGYAHNSSLLVNRGQQVAAGTTIALVGTTGASSGCHVHFEARVDGARVNPQSFMSSRGVTLG